MLTIFKIIQKIAFGVKCDRKTIDGNVFTEVTIKIQID